MNLAMTSRIPADQRVTLKPATFTRFSAWLREQTGVHLAANKQSLLEHRLHKRLVARGVDDFDAYLRLLQDPHEQHERELAIDLLTTHETYFFRENKHFDWLRQMLDSRQFELPLRIWSAACSTGEEVWSLAMLCAEQLGEHADWSILGSDISQPSLQAATRGHYRLSRAEGIPQPYLKRFCLKGIGPQEGTLLIDPVLRPKVAFQQVNLANSLPALGPFQVIFLRNVLIYFDLPGKQQIIDRILGRLAPGGFLVVSHSESLHGIHNGLRPIQPGVYYKKER